MPNQTPSMTLQATSNKAINLSDYKGKYLVVYFYPKDKTPGCTLEGKDFQANYPAFKKMNTEILGVSCDSLKSHEGFKEKYCFDFDLIADVDGKLGDYFGVIKDKSLFGIKFKGVERSTFLFDEKGKLIREWRKVKARNHVSEIMSTLKEIQKTN